MCVYVCVCVYESKFLSLCLRYPEREGPWVFIYNILLNETLHI